MKRSHRIAGPLLRLLARLLLFMPLLGSLVFAQAVGPGINLGSLHISGSRLTDWTKAGVDDGAGPNTTGWTVVDVSCNGSTDAGTIQSALNAAGNNTVVRLPAGTCRIQDNTQVTIVNKSNVVLRGRGSGNGGTTLLMGAASGSCAFIGKNGIVFCNNSGLGTVTNLSSTWSRGNTTVTAPGHSIANGDWMMIAEVSASCGGSGQPACTQADYGFSINPDGQSANTKQQIVKVTNVAGNVITFKPGLRTDGEGARQAFLRKVPMIEHVGLESMSIVNQQPSVDFANCVNFEQVANGWVTDVKFDACPKAGWAWYRVAHMEGSHNWMKSSGVITTNVCSGSSAQCVYGIGLVRSMHDSKMEDNIIDPTSNTPRMYTIDQGGSSTGNVMSYSWWGSTTTSTTGQHGLFFHGGYSNSNLVEGNVTAGVIEIDAYWGVHGPWNTLYRNRVGTNGDLQATIRLERTNGVQPVLSPNYIGNTTLAFAQVPFCNDLYRGGQCVKFDFVDAPPHPAPMDVYLERNLARDTRTAAGVCTGSGAPYACCTGAGTGSCNWGIALTPVTGATGTHCGTGSDNDCTPSGTNVGSNAQRLLVNPSSWDADTPPPSLYRTTAPQWWCQEACNFTNVHQGVGAWGDDFGGTLCKLPAQIRYEGGTCTPVGASPPPGPSCPPTPSWAIGRDPNCNLIVNGGPSYGQLTFTREVQNQSIAGELAPQVCPAAGDSANGCPTCNQTIHDSTIDNYLSQSAKNKDVIHVDGSLGAKHILIRDTLLSNAWACEGGAWSGPNGISCAAGETTTAQVDALSLLTLPNDNGWLVTQGVGIGNAQHRTSDAFQADLHRGTVTTAAPTGICADVGPKGALFQGGSIGNKQAAGAAATYITDCTTRGGTSVNCNTGGQFGPFQGAEGGKWSAVWFVGVQNRSGVPVRVASGVDKIIVVQGTGGTNGWPGPIGPGKAAWGGTTCPGGELVSASYAETGTTKVFCYAFIEDALAAGHEEPPFIRLSDVGWNVPPSGNPQIPPPPPPADPNAPIVTSILANFSEEVCNTGTEFPADGSDQVGDFTQSGCSYARDVMRFPTLGQISAGRVATNVKIATNTQYTSAGIASSTWKIGPYDTFGLSDPEADSGATAFSRTDLAQKSYKSGVIDYRTVGVKTVDITTPQSLADLNAAILAGATFSLAIQDLAEATTAEFMGIAEYVASSGKPTLIVTTVPGTGGNPTPPPSAPTIFTIDSSFSEDIDSSGVESPGDTVVTTAANFSEISSSTSEVPSDGTGNSLGQTPGGNTLRVPIRFSMSKIPASASITKVELIVNVFSGTNVGSDSWFIGPYNANGQGDPSADAAATTFARSGIASDNYGTYTDFRTNGLKTIDLTTAIGITDLEAAIDAGGLYSLAIQMVNETGTNRNLEVTDFTDATNPPKLRVTYHGQDRVGYTLSTNKIQRTAIRFPLASFSTSDPITKVELLARVLGASNVSADSWFVGPYNADGSGDPSADAGATAYSRSDVSADNYGTTTQFRTTGDRVIDLTGAPVAADIAARLAGGFITLAVRAANESTGASDRFFDLTEYLDPSAPPKLRITTTPATPPGADPNQVATGAASFSEDVTSTPAEFVNNGADFLGTTATVSSRVLQRFEPAAQIPANNTITKLQLVEQITKVDGDVSGTSWYIGGANGDGKDDPQADSASVASARADVSADNYGTYTDFRIAANTATAILTSDFSQFTNQTGTEAPGDFVGTTTTNSDRAQFRFDLSSLPTGVTITKVEFLVQSTLTGDVSAQTWDVRPYNSNCQGDPQADTGANSYSRSNTGTAYVAGSTAFRVDGVQTFDLGASGITDVGAAQTAASFCTVSIKQVNETVGTNRGINLTPFNDLGLNPPKLKITYLAGVPQSKTVDITTSASKADLAAAIQAGNYFTIAMRAVSETTGTLRGVSFAEYSDTVNPPKLIVTTVTPQLSIQKFVLYNADTDQAVYDPWIGGSGQKIDVQALPRYAVEAVLTPGSPTPGSVDFTVDGTRVTLEKTAPFAVFDCGPGCFNPFVPTPGIGIHLYRATPYTGVNGDGTVGSFVEISGETFDSGTPPPPPPPDTPDAVTLSADFGEDVNEAGTEVSNDGLDRIGVTATPHTFRAIERFPLNAVPRNETVTKVELIVNVSAVSGVGSDSFQIGPYAGTGIEDPVADAGASAYSRADVSSDNYGTFTDLRTTGLKTIDLTTAASLADVQAALSGSAQSQFFAVAIRMLSEAAGTRTSDLTAFTDGTNPPKLRITTVASSVVTDLPSVFSEGVFGSGSEAPGDVDSFGIYAKYSVPVRSNFTFQLSGIPTEDEISKVELIGQVDVAQGNAGQGYLIGLYGETGLGNPKTDSGVTAFARSNVSPSKSFGTFRQPFYQLGPISVDLTAGGGAKSVSDALEEAIDSATGKRFTIAIRQLDESIGVTHVAGLRGWNRDNPPILRVTHATPNDQVSTFVADFGEDVLDTGTETPGDGDDGIGVAVSGARVLRTVNRFAPTSGGGAIPPSAKVTKIELIVNVISVTTAASESWKVGPYNGNGQGDPNADVGSVAFSRSDTNADNYATTTDFRTTGVKTLDLTTPASIADLEAAVDAVASYAVAIRQVDETLGSDRFVAISEYIDGTNPPKLRVTFH